MATQEGSERPDAPFGALLRRYRQGAGLSQEALAERAGVSVRSIRDLERGIARTPHRETAALLAAALGLPSPGREAFVDVARGRAAPDLAAGTQAGTASPPLVGRGHELALLERHLAGDGPPLLLLAGEPGIGKSRLLREAAMLAPSAGWRVLSGGCTRRGDQEPFAPLVQALQGAIDACPPADRRRALQGCAWLARLLPELAEQEVEVPRAGTVPPEQERRLVFAAVACFLQNLRGPAGTLLLLDDLQWAGQDAVDLLAALLPGDAPPRVLGAYRSNEVAPGYPSHPLDILMADAASGALVAHHPLGPLAPPEARALLMALEAPGDGLLEAVGEAVVARAEGVPFFLISFAWALRQEARPEPGQVPWHIRQSIGGRLAALPAPARGVVRAAAVLGRSSPYPVLAAAVDLRDHALVPALAAACHAALLAEDGEGYSFVHDVVRETVMEGLGLGERRALHRRAAAAWEAQPGPAPIEALAYHHRQAGDAERAARCLLLAGERAEARYAHAAVAEHYRDAADCLIELGRAGEAAPAQARLGEVLFLLGRFDEALQTLDQARRTFEETCDLDGLGRVLAGQREIYYVLDRPDQLPDLMKPAIRRFEDAGPSRGLIQLYMMLIIEFIARMQYHAAATLLERLDRVLPAVEDVPLLIEVEVERGLLLHLLRRNDEALAVLERMVQRAEALERAGARPGDYSYGHLVAAEIHFFSGRFAQVARHFEAAIALCKRQGDPAGGSYYVGHLGYLAIHFGDLRQAKQHLDRALALRGTEFALSGDQLLLEFGYYHMVSGDYIAARDALEAGRGEYPEVWLDWLLAELDLLEGRAEQARARLLPLVSRQIGPDVYDLGLTEQEREITPPHIVFVLPRLAWAYLQLHELDEAERVAAWARAYAEEEGNRLALLDVLRVQALLHGERQRWPEAEAALEEGLTLARAMPYPYAEARLLHVYGTLHGQRGEAAAARMRLEAALAIFQRLGACKHAEAATHDLGALTPE